MKRFFILVMCLCMAVPINVCAANQKIKVNPVYQNSKVIKGKTKKRYRVQAKIGKKGSTKQKQIVKEISA